MYVLCRGIPDPAPGGRSPARVGLLVLLLALFLTLLGASGSALAAAGAWAENEHSRVRLVGTHLKATDDYRQVASDQPTVLVMGNEQAGMTDDMTGACDVRVKIPMAGRADSLNLAVATGVMLYELRRGQLT